jgi:hypothetical protein
MPATDLRAHLADLHRRADAADARARALAGDLSPTQLGWTPPDGGWSVGQVLEHLVVSADDYLPRMRAAAARAGPADAAARPWRPSLVGRLLVGAVDPRSARRQRAPRRWRPAPAPRPAVLEEFLRTQEALRSLLRAADGLDPARARLSSPVSPLLRLTLADALTILVLHAERHLAQAERVRRAPGFPG